MKRHLPIILLSIAAVIFVVAHFIGMAELPERVACHFDGAGRVNGWMSRSKHGSFMLAFGLGVPAFIVGLIWLMRYLPASLMNVPNPDYWRAPEHYPEALEIMQTWARSFAAVMLLWMTCFNRLIIAANQTSPPALNNLALVGLTVSLLIVVGCSVGWMLNRFKRTGV